MPKVKVGDINIYYEVHGKGEPLVYINGAGGNTTQCYGYIPVYSREYRLILFDNRGSGQTDAPDIPYTMEMLADDLAGLLDAIGIDAAFIFGVSFGGRIAQHFALRYPEKTLGLILGATTCGGPHSVPTDAATRNEMMSLRGLPPEKGAREGLRFFFTRDFIEKNPDLVEKMVAGMLAYPPPPHGQMRQSQAGVAHDTYERLPEIKAPTLVIHGEADRISPVENGRILASRIPNAELAILKNSGHLFMYEAEDESNRIILDFLKRHHTKRL
jgi:3-oxoadipate enol-lactonase